MNADRKFLFEYHFDNADWAFHVFAKDAAEAKEKIKQVALARYKGEVFAEIAVPGAGLLMRLWAWLTGRNGL